MAPVSPRPPAPELLEVRCCCTPKKVLGWLPLGQGAVPREGLRGRWQVRRGPLEGRLLERNPSQDRGPLWLELEIKRWGQVEIVTEVLTGRLVEQRTGGLAFYSEDTPLDVLRQVPGFVEAR